MKIDSMKVEDAIEGSGRKIFLNEHDQGLSHALFVKEPLAEDCEDVLDSRAGCLAEHVLAAKPIEIHLHWKCCVPMSQQRFRIGK